MFKTALIDGDNLVYNAGFAIERTFYRFKRNNEVFQQFEPGVTKTQIKNEFPILFSDNIRCVECKRVQPVHYAYHIVKMRLKMILELSMSDSYELYIGSREKDNFRYEVAKTLPYKAGRKKRPVEYDAIRQYMIDFCGAQVVSGCEADDILVKRHKELGEESILCSIDKDMLQSPGWHFNIDKKTAFKVTEEEAKLNLIFQIIFGDKADNIPGLKHLFVPRIGEVKVRKWIEENKSYILSRIDEDEGRNHWVFSLPWYREAVTLNDIDELYTEQLKLLTCGDV